MMKIKPSLRWIGVIFWLAVFLGACNFANPGMPNPISETSVMKTSAIDLTLTAFAQPTATNAPTSTLIAKNASATPQPAQIPQTGANPPVVQATPAPGTIADPACDRAAFVSDITYTDQSVVSPGATFVKTWRIKNNGTCSWKPGYSLVFAGNNSLGGPTSIALPNRVITPGAILDLSVTLKAPTTSGSYESDWMLRNLSGQLFGVGPNGNGFLWVKIKVPGNSQVLTFPTGETSAYVSGSVAQDSTATYVVHADAGQKIMVSLSSSNPALTLEVLTPQGAFMTKASDQLTHWQADLPASGDYLVTIVNTGLAADFNLNVTLPVRVSLPSGATVERLAGSIPPHSIHSYLVKALENQTMTVTIQSDKNDVFLTIYGASDDNPYVRAESGQTTFRFQVPSTQDYIIQCEATGEIPENYTLTFTIQ